MSQPTLSRRLSEIGKQKILRIGKARATRYAAIRVIPEQGDHWPLYRINEKGIPEKAGILTSLHRRQWHVSADARLQKILRGEFKEGLFPGFPWFLEDQRPHGFLGRLFARRHAPALRVGDDPRLWSDDELISSLLKFGMDSTGHFIIGDQNLEHYQNLRLKEPTGIRPEERAHLYPKLALSTLSGDPAGSSAAGEQPKFTVTLIDSPSSIRHGIVKFSPTPETRTGKRWSDLLTCEEIALQLLRINEIPAALSQRFIFEGRTFLESTRFDRVGAYGRRGIFSIVAFDSAYLGDGRSSWLNLAEKLEIHQWIGPREAQKLRVLWWFGTLIGNNDMHYGNISLLQEESGELSLAPSYDMLPMHYAPNSNGEIIDRPFEPLPPPPDEYENWTQASHWAEEFWRQIKGHSEINPDLRMIADKNSRIIAQMKNLID
jgi:hypothetical protein